MSGEKMKVIIVEDEFLAQQELSWLIKIGRASCRERV